jgi:hypothetical protein
LRAVATALGKLENWNWEFRICKGNGIQRRTTEYNREYENENSVQLSVGDTHGNFVVEEESEVSM